MTQRIYYIPGQGGYLRKGLGEALLERGLNVVGRELQGDFKKATFSEQVAAVAHDLKENHWNQEAQIIANSFGAYLFLHAQAELPPYVGRVLLLSPIIGAFGSEAMRMGFIPPRAKKLFELAESGKYPSPIDCQIHVGSEDWQSNPTRVSTFGKMIKVPVHAVENSGHSIDRRYVSSLLDTWLR